MNKLIGCLLGSIVFTTIALYAEEKIEAVPIQKQKYFVKWDIDGNGLLTIDEYMACVKKEFDKKGKTGHEEEAKKRFARRDVNEDGKLDIHEFLSKPWLKNREPAKETAVDKRNL